VGKLFWKFFVFIWLAQMAAVFGTGAFFWYERQSAEAAGFAAGQPRPPPSFAGHRPPPPEAHGPVDGHRRPPPPPPGGKGPGGGLPLLPLLAGLLASLLCAAGMAWYFSRPIRHLRDAFAGVGGGDLAVRVGAAMGGRRDELADLGRDFDAMAERLQALVAGQQRLLHDVSHEMRSPLARLQAAIGLLRQQPGRLEDSLARIEREGERMNRLVGELLTLSRLEAGVGGSLEAVEMGELLGTIVDDARFEGAARQVGIELVAGPIAVVSANPELLQRAIENVVRNALRHSPAGGVVRIAADCRSAGTYSLSIEDQGPGVAEADVEAIFAPFYRGAGAAGSDGYGLGLAIARQVIAAVNGKIAAKMKSPGAGSGLRVEITLPCQPPAG
jgi:two-component system, OmpR family, sensor kinase